MIMKATGVGTFLAVAIAVGLLTVSIATAAKHDQREVRMQAGHQEQLAEDQLEEAIQLCKRTVDKGYSSERLVQVDGSAPLILYSKDVKLLAPADWSPDGESIVAVLARKNGTNQFALFYVAKGSVHVLNTLRSPELHSVSQLVVLEGMSDWLWCFLHFCKRWG
jgi:hypothetical protein